jgi:glutamine synthetase
MDSSQVVQAAQEAGLALVRFLYCDNSIIIRGKSVPVAHLERRMADGVGLSRALLAVNSLDEHQPVAEMSPVGEVRLSPDPDTFSLLPYARGAGAMICDLVQHDGRPWEACARSFLKRVVQEVAEQGLQVRASFEMEYTLAIETADGYRPFDQSLCYSSIALQATHDYSIDLLQALEGQGVEVELCHPELSPGQHELSISYSDAVKAADNQVWLRETIRAVAADHGLYASFAPKPFPEYVGNGAHIHLSLWDGDGRNIFYDPAAPQGFSSRGLSFLGGLLRHLPGLAALTCASVNSYRRLAPHSLSGAFAIYGYDNREAALRIPSPFRSDVEGSTNLEFKAADASGNPYLALGAILVAGLDGLNRELDPGPPVNLDPAALSEDQLASMNIKRLPATLDEALDELEADPILMNALGELLSSSYLAIKRSEVIAYDGGVEEAEFAGNFYKF